MMRRFMLRLCCLFVLVGLVGVVFGSIPPPYSKGLGDSGVLKPGELRGDAHFLAGDVNILNLSVYRPGHISLYLFDWSATMEIVRHEGNLSGLSPVYALENVSRYEGVIPVPRPGVYFILVRNPTNASVVFHVEMDRRLLQSHILVPSAVLTVIGISLGIILQLGRRRWT